MRAARYVVATGIWGMAAHDLTETDSNGHHHTRCGKVVSDGFTSNATRHGMWLCGACWANREHLGQTLRHLAVRVNYQAMGVARSAEDYLLPAGRPITESVALTLEARELQREARLVTGNDL